MSAQLAGDHACSSCGHAVVAGVCPSCDRPHGRLSPLRWIWFRHGRALIVGLVALPVGSALVIVALGLPGAGRPAHTGRAVPAAPVGHTVAVPGAVASRGSVFQVLGTDANELGQRPTKGFAFVVRTAAGSSDLLTDYQLIVEGYLNGNQTVDLQRGGQTFTAAVVAVSPDPHVALLRIQGEYPPFPIGHATPRPHDTVIVDPLPPAGARAAAMVAYEGRGGTDHLTFSVSVPTTGAGAPVLDSGSRVVGMAEPSAPFNVPGVGFAVPIGTACAAVAAC